MTQPTEATVLIKSSILGYAQSSPSPLEKQMANGRWLEVTPQPIIESIDYLNGFNNLGSAGTVKLDEGHYRLLLAFGGSNVYGAQSYSWGGVSAIISAVPEQGTLGMMSMGLIALSLLVRRKI